MDVRHTQTLLAEAGYYKGAIDGDAGPQTMRAVEIVEKNGRHDWSAWAQARKLVAAGQVVLGALGYQPGVIDGWAGHNTAEALTSYLSERAGQSAAVERTPGPDYAPSHLQAVYPLQRDMAAFYGPAGGNDCTAGIAELPFPFVIAWNTAQTIQTFRCHVRLARPMTVIFAEAARHYGRAEMERLRLHLFGGCFNHRNMRGGSTLSTHAYGAAVDIDPERNQLRWGRDRAQLAQPEYEPFWRIVAGQGALSLGRAANRDWMHFQFARL
jgi:hypothetical protein